MENYLFLSLHNCDEAWVMIVKRNYLVEYKIATGSSANNTKEKHLLNTMLNKGIVKPLC